MTVPAYTGPDISVANGVTVVFPYSFRILDASHLQVQGNGVDYILGQDYTVTGVGNDGGGNAVFSVPPADGTRIVRNRNMPIIRDTNYTNLGDLLAQTLNEDQDSPIMMLQQLFTSLALALKIPLELLGTVSTQLPYPEPMKGLRWNGANNALENYPISEFSAPGGSDNIGWTNSGAGALLRSVMSKLRETASPDDYASFAQAVAAAAGKPFNLLNGGWGGAPFVNEIPTGKIRVIAGTIRQNIPPNQHTWSFISDAAHVPVGFRTTDADISANAANLVLTFPETFKRVITLVVVPDETLAAQWGLQCGSSVSLDSIAINMSINCEVGGRVWYDGATWQHKIQSMGQTDVDGNTPVFSAGNLTIGHPFTPGSANNPILVAPSTNNGAVVPLRPAHKLAPSESAFVVNFIDDAGTGLVTTASTRMSLVYKKSFAGAIRVDNTGASAGLPLYQGNLWLFGIMEAEEDD